MIHQQTICICTYLLHLCPVFTWSFLWTIPAEDYISNYTRLLHPFNGPLSGTTQVSRYQKNKTSLDFTDARDSEWQWHPVCKSAPCSSQITTPVPHHSVFTGRMPFLPPNQQRQSTASFPEVTNETAIQREGQLIALALL